MQTSRTRSEASWLKSSDPLASMGTMYSSTSFCGKVAPTTEQTALIRMHRMTIANRTL